MRIYLLILSLSCTLICNSQVLTINVSEHNFGVDESNSLIVSHIQNISNYSNTSEYDEIVITLGPNNYKFISIPESLEYSNSYLVTNSSTSNQYDLYFTLLPIILIESNNAIVDEPKVLANFTYSDEEQTLASNIGIELRGGSSQTYPKKTYDLEFWDDEVGNETNDVQFGELRSDDDWILDALYNEPLRLRSYVANKLWLEIHTAPYYIDDEPNAKSGADVMYVEMFLNGQYNGLYNLSEQVDKKQLKLKSYNDNIRGELYKGISWGATTFTSLPSYDNESRIWSGYEYKYPKEDDITDWGDLYQFTDFVMNSSETSFASSIWTKFDEDNCIDYFLFLNLIRATDNTGKNIYLAKYKANEPYFYVPWDLDGCFGTIWDGTNENITNDILCNGFINRAIDINPNDISTNIANKWFSYRNNILSSEYLSNFISEQYNFLQTNKIYERESLVYSNYLFDNEDLSYTLTWLENRLEYLDIYFREFLSINEGGSLVKTEIIIYPNPATDRIYISSSISLPGTNFKIYNNLGQLVLDGIIDDNNISVEKLKKGFYFIVIDSSSQKFIKK
jgi:spore coat protein H